MSRCSHSDRGSEFDNAGAGRAVRGVRDHEVVVEGVPFGNAVDESTNKTLEAEFVWREQFSSLSDLRQS